MTADYNPDMTTAEAAQIVIDAVTDADGTSVLKQVVTVEDVLSIAREID